MKKVKLIELSALFLICSCTNQNLSNNQQSVTNYQSATSSQTNRIIDCYTIDVRNGTSTIYKRYSLSYSKVYEYKSSNGDCIYTDERRMSDGKDVVIFAYDNKYKSDYTEYSYVGFVGWLTMENNYYLDLDNNIIDSETKWSEYLYDKNPSDEEIANNKKAYECASKNYYYDFSYYVVNKVDDKYYCNLQTDMIENSLEIHKYIKLGDNSIIEYKKKWF